jgi:hypothetical protein
MKIKSKYANILGEMQAQFTTQNVPKDLTHKGTMPGGDLPQGEVRYGSNNGFNEF